MRALTVITLIVTSWISTVNCDCTDRHVQQDLHLKQTEGLWYGQYILLEENKIAIERCLRIVHHVESNNLVLTKSTLSDKSSSKWITFHATGDQKGTDGKIVMIGKGRDGGKVHFEYWIIGTDYNNFMIIYVCAPGVQNVWTILTRKPSIDSTVKKAIEESLSLNQLSFSKFTYTLHDGCPPA